MSSSLGLTLIGACPALQRGMTASDYLAALNAAAARAERAGWSAMLVYSDHAQVDPWLVAHLLLGATRSISPLVAVQPLYMHPFSVAKTVASLSALHGRAVHLNFISGGFPRDLETFCDTCDHDARYDRVAEYGIIIRRLLSERRPCTFKGQFYQVEDLQLKFAQPPPERQPIFTISGSSSGGLAAARKLQARAIQYLRPSDAYGGAKLPGDMAHGARLGLVVRETSEAAWQAAQRRFPESQAGAALRDYFVGVSDSVWVKELGKDVQVTAGHPYWLGPYKNGYSACPFLVGKHEDVAAQLAGYMDMGIRTFLLETPESDADADHISAAFKRAEQLVLSLSRQPASGVAG
jgi:alkanesulfonate monooxygenase